MTRGKLSLTIPNLHLHATAIAHEANLKEESTPSIKQKLH